jgi:glucose uptake protein
MILPGSYAAVVLLLFLGMLSWGTWANTFKAAGEKWRYELYCFDFALGVILVATVIALTVGNLGFDGFSVMDDLRLAGKRQEFLGLCAGVVFNLGNMLLLGAVSLAGLAIAFPIAMGVALVAGALWNFLLNPGGSAAFLFGGTAVTAGAVVVAIFAYRVYFAEHLEIAVDPAGRGLAKTRLSAKKTKKTGSRVIIISLAGGLLLGSFGPLVQAARSGENGLGPYSTGLMFAIGVFFSTFVFNLFFMNLPVKGEPVDVAEYFRDKGNRHLMGILGGIIWYIGEITALVAGRVEGVARVQPAVAYLFSQGGIIIAILCGLYIWKELPGATMRVKTWVGLTVVLLLIGIGLASVASVAPAS